MRLAHLTATRMDAVPLAERPVLGAVVGRVGAQPADRSADDLGLAWVGGDSEARQAYWQRWKAETVMSATRQGRDDALSARLEATRRVQALLRGVAYNLSRLVAFGSPP
jgi:hypothetical protein